MGERFLVAGDREHRQDRAKTLLLHGAGLVRHPGKEGRLEEISGVIRSPGAAGQEARPTGDRVPDLFLEEVESAAARQWADGGLFLERVTGVVGIEGLPGSGEVIVEEGLMYVDPLYRAAGLPGVVAGSVDGVGDGEVEVGIPGDVGRVFTAELEAGYALGRFEGLNNEPDMEAPWTYHYAGRPDRTAEIVHHIVHQQFGVGRGGLPGNDDSGGLSSWYVWASLGVFPAAGQNLFFVNAPSFRRAEIAVVGGRFLIETEGFVEPEAGGAVQYVQSAALNGLPLERSWISGDEFHGGGTLTVRLGAEPTDWGRRDRPPSHPQA